MQPRKLSRMTVFEKIVYWTFKKVTMRTERILHWKPNRQIASLTKKDFFKIIVSFSTVSALHTLR
jgi:hypothetical protein